MLIRESDQNHQRDGAECDWCIESGAGITYQKHYAFVARGATGRYCEVMWLCDSCGDNQADGREVPTADEARDEIDSRGPDHYADF